MTCTQQLNSDYTALFVALPVIEPQGVNIEIENTENGQTIIGTFQTRRIDFETSAPSI